ncbi:ABC transporter ATP-binding protein [Pseudoclavibacter albus]|uniref:ABC transporter ATP-binding protein n=1 Tax=Pseudoclavibacter albus TaxID=272241 RepID=UPI00082507FE|nr:ATP-binding cassette domain-containing protein [Pseudoclavibacter alba]
MLEIQGITKTYGDRRVLDGVSFTVKPGRLTGFVGANGAGKTTTMRSILGLVEPEAGQVLVDGKPIGPRDRARFGYMPEERGLYAKMRILEQVAYFGELHGLPTAKATKNAKSLLTELGLGERLNDKLQDLSLGNQQRVQIAATLVHEPQYLMLDEPFSGLDPVAVDVVLSVLQRFAAAGVPVLFSSHQLDVVERLADDLVIIANGQIRASGARLELQAEHSRGLYDIATDGDAGWMREAAGIEVIDFDRGKATVRATDEHSIQALLREAMNRGQVLSFGPRIEKLSTIYKEVVR